VDIAVLDRSEGNVVARGAYYGGPDYEFVIGSDGQVYFRVVGDTEQALHPNCGGRSPNLPADGSGRFGDLPPQLRCNEPREHRRIASS
jgi:hypothetical protein